MTTTLSAITNANTFSVWKDRTNELVTHAGKAVTLGDSETNSGNMKLNGNIVLENNHIITVDTITATNSEIEFQKNLRIDSSGASLLLSLIHI